MAPVDGEGRTARMGERITREDAVRAILNVLKAYGDVHNSFRNTGAAPNLHKYWFKSIIEILHVLAWPRHP